MRRKTKTVITWIVLILLAGGIVAGYFIISDKKHQDNYEKEAEQTEVAKLLEKNLDSAYPATPREVVKLYSRIMKCFYEEKLEEKEMVAMADQLRMLFDEELLEKNPRDEHIAILQAEILDYKTAKRTVTNYQISSAKNVVTWENEGNEYARLVASYTQKQDTKYLRVYEEFVLRKNEDGRWKIVGWKLADTTDVD